MNAIKILVIAFFSYKFISLPWESWRNTEFRDRLVYFAYAESGKNIIDYTTFDPLLSYFKNEWLWHYLIQNVYKFTTYEFFFGLISFITVFTMSLILLKDRKKSYLTLIILFNPIIVDLVLSQFRICLALTIMLIAYLARNLKIISFVLLIAACLIHSSSFIFIFIAIAIFFTDNKRKDVQTIILILLGMMLSILLGSFLQDILHIFNDRRSGYDIDRVNSSLSYLSFWILNLLILTHQAFKFKLSTFEQKYSLTILAMVTFNAIFGGYSTRFIAVTFPLIMKSNLTLSKYNKLILFGFYVVYLLFQWKFWLGK